MAQTEQSADQADRRRRYRYFFLAEAVLAVLAVVLVWGCTQRPQISGTWMKWPLICLVTAVALWHVVAIPIGFFYLIGNPIVMSMRSNATHRSCAFRKQLRQRTPLGDDEFFARFYRESGIPEHVVCRVRHWLRELDSWADRLTPSDCIDLLLDDELQLEDALDMIVQDLGIAGIPSDSPLLDRTLNDLIANVHRWANRRAS